MDELSGMTVLRGRTACAQALRHPGLTSDPGTDTANLLFLDGPAHARLRGVVRSAITALEPLPEHVVTGIREVVGALGDRFEVVSEFARPIAGLVTEALLGTSGLVDDDFLDHLEATTANLDVWSGTSRADGQRSAMRLALLLTRADGRPGGALDRLRAARSADGISEDELLLTPVVLAHAAYENSANYLALAAIASVTGPRPVRELAVDTCPARYVFRRARTEVRLGDTVIPSGTVVALALDSAGLPFGLGPHACPGSAVALAEADIALGALAPLLGPDSAVDGLRWKPHPAYHGPATATIVR